MVARTLHLIAAVMGMCAAAIVGCKSAGQEGNTHLVEFRSYTLRPGTRPAFHRRFVEQSLPMLLRWNIDPVAYGPSPHDANSYFLVRAYPDLARREASENAFYASDEWRKGPRDAVLADIESYTTFVLDLDDATVARMRAAGREQLSKMETTMAMDDAQVSPTTERERLLQLNDGYIAAFMTADVSWYRAHLADDFVCIEPDGSVLDRPAFLIECAKGPDVATYDLAETSVRFYGDTAVVQARGVFTRRDGSKGTSRYTDVWVRFPGNQWKAVSAQVTRST